jgi:hypothetical protein
VTVPPARLPAALLAAACLLGGCAGTDAPASPGTGAPAGSSSSSGSSSATTGTAPAGTRIEVAVAGGQVTGDAGRVLVAVGEPVTLVATSDVADELHVHGYDLTADLPAGRPAELTFDATIPGVFEVELHDAGTVLLTLQVQ